MASHGNSEKPHAVVVPYPAQGHITPLLQLTKLLHSRNFHITFVNTEYNHNRLVNTRGRDSVEGIQGFRFETIPDGLPPSDHEVTQPIPVLCESTSKNCLGPFRDLLRKLNESEPRVSCIVADGVMSFTLDVARELRVPEVLFWTTSACGFYAYAQYKELIDRGLVPLKDMSDVTNGYLDTPIDFIPGMNKLRLKDVPAFIRTTDPEDIMIRFTVRETERAIRASAIVLNTFHDLEHKVLENMASIFPPIYYIGPLFLQTNRLPPNSPHASISLSLWKEDSTCIEWLGNKEPNSVVFVNFGSVAVMTNEQMVEFAWGLANSKRDFLWIIRPDLVRGEHSVLPEEFLIETRGRGLLANWCNQEAVLSHPSIGVFLTHCGWNSTLESISGGVPMICWPFGAEQMTNCRYICEEWEIGMEIDSNVKREEVERLIRELMEGENGKEMRNRALKLKDGAWKAVDTGGCSSVDLDRVVEVLLAKQILGYDT